MAYKFNLADRVASVDHLDRIKPEWWAHTFQCYGITAEMVRDAVATEMKNRLKHLNVDEGE